MKKEHQFKFKLIKKKRTDRYIDKFSNLIQSYRIQV